MSCFEKHNECAKYKVCFDGKMIISLSLNITMNQVGGASVIAKFHS